MSTAILNQEAAQRASLPGDWLELMVRQGEHGGKTIRLISRKCTIGSAKGCTLRLEAAGVPELAMWVVRGSAQTIVRSNSSQVELNGQGFTDAVLKPGDVLKVGPVEFVVVSCPLVAGAGQATEPMPTRAVKAPSGPPGSQLPDELNRLSKSWAEISASWQAEKAALEARLNELTALAQRREREF